jgi:hypothetical protein
LIQHINAESTTESTADLRAFTEEELASSKAYISKFKKKNEKEIKELQDIDK